jgi:importin-9
MSHEPYSDPPSPSPQSRLKPVPRLIQHSSIIGNIAIHDFPEQWPALLPTVLGIITSGIDAQMHGALKVLQVLVEESLDGGQLLCTTCDIATCLTRFATDENRGRMIRALAICVFRGCLELLGMARERHGEEVKEFVGRLIQIWTPFFLGVLRERLPEAEPGSESLPESWNSAIALKVQACKTLLRLQRVFPSLLYAQSTDLFIAVREGLASTQVPYTQLYIENEAKRWLEDVDGLSFSLDLLIVDKLDYINQYFRAQHRQAEPGGQLGTLTSGQDAPWMAGTTKMLPGYSRITLEEEKLWQMDCSLYLAEEARATANYTARVAAGDFLIKMNECFPGKATEGLFDHIEALFLDDESTWRDQEAALYLFARLTSAYQAINKSDPNRMPAAILKLVEFAINRPEEPLLRAKGFLVAGAFCQTHGTAPPELPNRVIDSIASEDAEVVQAACITVIEWLISAGMVPSDRQIPVLEALGQFVKRKGTASMEDDVELLVTLVGAVRGAILLDCHAALSDSTPSIESLLTLAEVGARNLRVPQMVFDTVREISQSLADPESFTTLFFQIAPACINALESSDLTQYNPFVTVSLGN